MMPLTILVVAAGVSWWSSRVARQEQAEVHAFVTAVCDDVREGRNPSARLAATDGLIRNTLAARLRSLLGNSNDSSQRLTVKVVTGDTPEAGTRTGSATHTVILSLDGTETLGLRVVHGGSGTNIAIIGFWVPE
jgi:hypothetical protein